MYVVSDGTMAIAVDPYDAELVGTYLKERELKLTAIWNTHHHHDHVGGNERLVAAYPGIDVVAHMVDQYRVPCVTRLVVDGDEIDCLGRDATIIHTPGHSEGGISYYVPGAGVSGSNLQAGALFVGDAIFGAGCGRILEGSAEQLYHSLHEQLANIPEDTTLCYGHNYTRKNLDFSLSILPEDDELLSRSSVYDEYMDRTPPPSGSSVVADVDEPGGSLVSPRGEHVGLEPLPTLGYERQTSLFFRVSDRHIQLALRAISAKDGFVRLRSRRNTF